MLPGMVGSRPRVVTSSMRSSACHEALTEIVRGLAGLMAALFLYAWSGFDWAIFLFGVVIFLTGGHLFLRPADAESANASLQGQLRTVVGPIASGWRLLALVSLFIVLVILGVIRIAALRDGSMGSSSGSDAERWLPLLFSALVPFWFVISGLLNRLPRHLLAGIVGFAGAAAGPLLGLAWRDSLALAAAVISVVLIADGGIACGQSCRPA